MTGPALAAAAGLGFGVFQTLNRRAVGGMGDAYLATFLQLLIALCVLTAASLATEDIGLLREATTVSLVWFSAAGLVHFFVG
jgi:drug/metabolite transporter (DMT)-like permease